MIDNKAPILPGISAANVEVGSQLADLADYLASEGLDFATTHFENAGKQFKQFCLTDLGLTVCGDGNGKVLRISCSPPYRGTFQERFYPGIPVSELRKLAMKTLVMNGMIIVNGEYGAFFEIPEIAGGLQLDDVDFVDDLPGELVLSTLHVMDRKWWLPSEHKSGASIEHKAKLLRRCLLAKRMPEGGVPQRN